MIWIIVLLLGAMPLSAWQVELRPQARVAPGAVTLAQVANLPAEGADLAGVVVACPDGSQPFVNLTADRVQQSLARAGYKAPVSGGVCALHLQGAKLDGDQLLTELKVYLAGRDVYNAGSRINLLNTPSPYLPDERVRWGFDNLRPIGANRWQVRCTAYSEGRAASAFNLTLSVDKKTVVYRTLRPLKAGQLIGVEDVAPDTLYASRAGHGFKPGESVLGREMAVSLPAGATLKPGQLRRNRDVMRGRDVDLSVKTDNVTLTLTARATQSGDVGQQIWCMLPKGRIKARVTGPGTATATLYNR